MKKQKKKQKGVFRYLLSYVKQYKIYAILTPLIVMIESIIEVLIPKCMSNLIAQGIGTYDNANENIFVPGEFKYVLIWGGVMVLMAIISTLAGALGTKFAVTASQGFAKNLRQAQFEAIQHYSFANTDKFQTSSLVTRLTTDVTNTASAFQMSIRLMFRAPVMMVFATIMAFTINPSLSMVYLVAIPILFVAIMIIMISAFPKFRAMLSKFDAMNRDVQENLISIRVVKSFVREQHETEKFIDTSSEVRKLQIGAEKLIALGNPIMNLCMYGSLVVIAFVGGIDIIKGINGMQYSDLTAFITYTTQILFSLMMISMFLVNFVLARASMGRIAEVLQEKPTFTDENNDPSLQLEDGSIVFKDVNFSYKNDENSCVLSNINLSIKSGETIGIIGGTGSSKSTIVSLIPRLYDVTTGELIVGNHNVKDYKLKTLRDNVSMVLQKNVLFSGTIKDNLRWGDENATDEEIVEACKKACAHDFITSFPDGYDTDLGQGGVNVSGGQKQRLCIARALLKKPKIIILDDSTSAVDTATDAKIRDEFKKNLSDVTTIIIAQRISSVQNADKIIVLDNGKISGFDTHKNLLKNNEIYKEVYNSQMKGAE